MEYIDITVWTVMQGDEDSTHLRDLKINRAVAKEVFDVAAKEIDGERTREEPDGTLTAHAGLEWVRLESRTLTSSLHDLIAAIAQAPIANAPAGS